MAGGAGTRLDPFTRKRAKPAVPFAGKYRIIDFTLSNCVNSGIYDVLVLTQYRPHSLNEHIGRGRPWDLDRSFTGGIKMLQPYMGREDSDWYSGTADAVYQNLNMIRRVEADQQQPDLVLVLSGDHVYEMDFSKLIDFHQDSESDATVCTISVSLEEATRFGILATDRDDKVLDFVEKPSDPPGTLASMGVYLFNLDVLEELLADDSLSETSSHDFGKDIIPRMIEDDFDVFAFPFDGYWVDVGTVDAYWETQMALVANPPSLELNKRSWIIHTRSEERPPLRIESGTIIIDSLLTHGSSIAKGATIERSILSPGVRIEENAVVRESIIMTDSHIKAGTVIERAVIDKNVVIHEGAQVGEITPGAGDLGIVRIGKNAHLPAGIVVGRGAMIGSDIHEADFPGREIPEGAVVDKALEWDF
jgi:glucose-1-phosphate adenylyltransferase